MTISPPNSCLCGPIRQMPPLQAFDCPLRAARVPVDTRARTPRRIAFRDIAGWSLLAIVDTLKVNLLERNEYDASSN